jgi:hypothetical protein
MVEVQKRSVKENWLKLKEKLIEVIRLSQMFKRAEKYRRARDKHEIDFIFKEETYRLQWLLLSPDNFRRQIFEYIMTFVGLLDLFINIYCLYIGSRASTFNFLILPLYIIEVFANWISMHYNETQLVKDINKIIIYYLKYTFFIDFIGLVPLFPIDPGYLILKMIRFLKLRTYLQRINRFVEWFGTKIFRFRNEIIINIQKISKFLIILSLIIHTLSWVWASLGIMNDKGWVTTNADNFSSKHSLSFNLAENPSKTEIYIASVYWALTAFTTVGYGDILGETDVELYFNCLVMFIGIGFFGYIIGNIKTVIVQNDSVSELKEVYENEIGLWLIKLNKLNNTKIMSPEYFIDSYFFFMKRWDMDYSLLKKDEFFNQLKPRIQNEIWDLLFDNIYKTFHIFFKDLEKQFVREVVLHMKYENFANFIPNYEKYKDDRKSIPPHLANIIMSAGAVPDKVFFILGDAYASNSSGRFIYFKLPKGSYFGVSHLLTGTESSYSLWYDEKKGVNWYTVNATRFLKICKKYPLTLEKLLDRSIKRRKLFRQYKVEALKEIIQQALFKRSGKIP